jgi:probable rRNA maturation factor
MEPDPPSTIALTVGVPAWRWHLADPERICREALLATLAWMPDAPWLARAEVSVLLADDATVRRLNADYRGRDRPTNVLSFPMFEDARARAAGPSPAEAVPLGDIVLAFETVRDEAQAEAKPFPHHVSHLLIHGCLHLLGYDHRSATDAAVMEGMERDVLAQLGIPDPYAGDAAQPAADAAGALSAEKQ